MSQTWVVRLPTLSGTIYAGSVGLLHRRGLHVLQRAQSVVPSAACAAGPFSLLPTIAQLGSGCDWLNSNHCWDWLAISVRGQGKAPTENATYQKMPLLSLSNSHPSHTAVKTTHTPTHTYTRFQWFHASTTMVCKTGQQLPVPGQGANLAC